MEEIVSEMVGMLARLGSCSQLVLAGLATRRAVILVLAEPSLHHQMTVAELVLALTVFYRSRRLGLVPQACAVITLIASVHP